MKWGIFAMNRNSRSLAQLYYNKHLNTILDEKFNEIWCRYILLKISKLTLRTPPNETLKSYALCE